MQRYELVVERAADGSLSINSSNDGFLPFELLGFLDFKADDIRRQIRSEFVPEIVSRKVIID